MDDLKISFRFDHLCFSNFTDIDRKEQEPIKQMFRTWERKIRHAAATQTLNDELQFDSLAVVSIAVETKKEG
ncbi:hypothetical protein [Peribacillus simplex]|uniref:hypothetical protein n=1 Tax=Peribacillus simplex TaxID=1478 RepID=UPI000BA78F30|nr:hypothetical protein [Peribacillus simplex]PAL14827.1 hypothetical protein B8W99_05295 [Peribacillus simplex]